VRFSCAASNAVFNLRNFWDCRANGSNVGDPFSLKSEHQRSGKKVAGILRKVNVAIESCVAGLNSQAAACRHSSCSGATPYWKKLHQKQKVLDGQAISPTTVCSGNSQRADLTSTCQEDISRYWQSPRRGLLYPGRCRNRVSETPCAAVLQQQDLKED
jgi:hypothetical protein